MTSSGRSSLASTGSSPLVELQIVPLQLALVPIARQSADMGMRSSYIGIWLIHTALSLPYAIYLMRDFFGTLSREMFRVGPSRWRQPLCDVPVSGTPAGRPGDRLTGDPPIPVGVERPLGREDLPEQKNRC